MAVLSRIYFENMFCLLPFPTAKDGASEIGIKVALGDSGRFFKASTNHP